MSWSSWVRPCIGNRSRVVSSMAAEVSLAALRAGASWSQVVETIVGALGYVDRLEDAEPVVNEGLELTDRDPQLLTRWIQWLADHGQPDRSGSLAREALAACLARLEAAPEDRSLIDPFVRALYSVTPTDRREAVDRAQTALGGRADELVELGQALYRQSFPGCELMAAEVSLAALRAGASWSQVVETIVGALGYVDRLEDAEPVVNEGLELTDRDPQLLTRWIQWLADHGQPDRSGSLAREALAACLARLEAAPEDRSLIDPFVRALYSVTPTDRREAVDRAQTALGGRADELVELGQALYRQSFPGCELMAAEVSLAALRAGASWSQVVETIVGALGYVDRLEDAEPVVNEGLELTDRDPQLLTRWIQWLADHGQPDRSGSLAREALAACLARLEAAPEDRSLIDPFVGALGYVDRLEDAEPVVNEGLELTDRDPQLLTRWIQWLADHGQPDRSGSLAREALAACLARLEAAPEDRSLIDPFVRALYSVTPTDRREAVDRAQTALGGRADELVELGQALYRQSFPGCELMAAEVSLAALRAGASWSQVVETIVGALGYVDRLEDAEPVVNEGLELTDRDPQLLTRWSQWLLDNGRPELAERAYLDALRRDPSLAVSGAEGILNVYARRRDNASLLRSFDRIDSVRGLSLYTVVWRASVYSGRGQVDQALDEILSGLALDNQDSYEYIELIERLLFTLRDLNRTRNLQYS